MNYIRHLIAGSLLLGLCVSSRAQKHHDITLISFQVLKYDTGHYNADARIPFKSIEVLDYRFDTTKIGYATYGNRENHTKLLAPGGLRIFLNGRLNEYFRDNLDPHASRTLTIVLKKLWLQYGSVNQMLNAKDISYESAATLANRNSVCLADIDVFSRTDSGYQALLRLTQNFVINKFSRSSDELLLLMPFDSIIHKIQSLDMEAALAKKKNFLPGDIDANYKKRFDIPVLTANLSKGVFLSFADFKNNKASYPDFGYRTHQLSTEITYLQDGRETVITDCWGFFDGGQLYIKPGFLPFKAVRQGNTFDLLGCLRGTNQGYTIPLPGPAQITVSSPKVPLYPLQVDMETGKVY